MKARVAVFSGPALRKNLDSGDGLDYQFFPPASLAPRWLPRFVTQMS